MVSGELERLKILAKRSLDPYINQIIQGDCRKIMRSFPSKSIDCVMMSPPYYGLRDYGKETETIWGGNPKCKHKFESYEEKLHSGRIDQIDSKDLMYSYYEEIPDKIVEIGGFCKKCGAWKGQLGLEPTPELYVEHLKEIFKEIYRILKPSGSFWLVVGDTYRGGHPGGTIYGEKIISNKYKNKNAIPQYNKGRPQGKLKNYKEKCLLMIPERIAFACIDIGFILRNKIIWYKPNHMPSPVEDRFTNSWEYVFFFVKSKKYYFNLDEVREPHIWAEKDKRSLLRRVEHKSGKSTLPNAQYGFSGVGYHPVGKNPGDVIKISSINISELLKKIDEEAKKMEEMGYEGKTLELKSQKHLNFYLKTRRKILKILKDRGEITDEEEKILRYYLQNHCGHPLGSNPGDVIKVPYAVQPRLKEFVEFRNLPSLEELKEYLNYWRKKAKLTIDEIEQKLNSQAPHHWFNGESYPSVEDWLQLKKLLNFDDKYDKAMTEVFIKSSEKQNHPLGKNPGDVIKLSPKYLIGKGHTNRQGLNRPLDIVTIKAYKEYQKPIAEFLKKHIKSIHKRKLDEAFGKHKWRHWIRTDFSGASLPGVEDWFKLKEILGLDKTPFDDKIYEIQKLNIPIFQSNRNPGDFWEIPTQPFKGLHFATYPEKLCENPIKAGCPKDGIVLDPMCGSGTTCVVAKKLGRKFIGIDINKEYVELAKKRLIMKK